MSLIEQLGGYGKALSLFRGCPWDSGTVDIPNPRSKGMLRLDLSELNSELLEYRRQHNIFEVGDPVIRKWNNQLYWIISNIDNGSEFLIHKNKDAKFKDCKVCELPCNLSHATDAEIKEGRRL